MKKHSADLLRYFLMAAVGLASFAAPVDAENTRRQMDLDNDGSKEADVFFENGKIVLATMDKNGDGTPDTTVHYKNGFRDFAEIDSDFNGNTDTSIRYYFTGIPISIERDKNGDGKPDSSKYLKNGFVYKREWDRNFDGVPDTRVLFDVGSDLKLEEKNEAWIDKQWDSDFDGTFEKSIRVKKRAPRKRIELAPGALGEMS